MASESGLVFACLLDGHGGGRFGGWDLVRSWKAEDGVLWMHLDLRADDVQTWLREESGLDAVATAALLARETRPRSVVRDDALLVNLRGVNLNRGAEPDDMISLRVELEGRRVITSRRRRLKAVQDVRRTLEAGRGPVDTGDFLVRLIDSLLRRMAAAFEALDEAIDSVQERVPTESGAALRAEIATIRNQVISMRRYLSPQRDAVARLLTDRVSWLTPMHKERLRDLADRTVRRVEDLEEARDRASVAHEELSSRLAEQLNRTMYVVAMITAIFLPLSLLTGLLGINVGGMPGAGSPVSFWIVCGLLAALAGLQWWWFKRRRWL